MKKIQSRHFECRYIEGPPGGKSALMIVLHGLGDSYQGFLWLPSALNIPGLNFLLLNAPDPYYGGHSWYDFAGDQAGGIRRSRKLLFDLLEDIESQGVASADILLFGFSQGCLMSLDVGLRWPRQLRGICGVSGYLGFAEEYPRELSAVAKSQNILTTHGLEDPVVPFEASAAQYAALLQMGLKLEFKTYAKAHTILPGELEDVREWVSGRIGD